VIEILDVMHRIVASAGQTRCLIALEGIKNGHVNGVALEGARAEVAMKALAIVVRRIELDRIRDRADVLDINVAQAAELGPHAAIENVIGMAGVAGFIGGNAVVLKVGGGDMVRVVHIKTLAVLFHDVAGETKRRCLGTFHVRGESDRSAEEGKKKHGDESEDLAFARRSDGGASKKQDNQSDTQ
jgi:hypothetical protein